MQLLACRPWCSLLLVVANDACGCCASPTVRAAHTPCRQVFGPVQAVGAPSRAVAHRQACCCSCACLAKGMAALWPARMPAGMRAPAAAATDVHWTQSGHDGAQSSCCRHHAIAACPADLRAACAWRHARPTRGHPLPAGRPAQPAQPHQPPAACRLGCFLLYPEDSKCQPTFLRLLSHAVQGTSSFGPPCWNATPASPSPPHSSSTCCRPTHDPLLRSSAASLTATRSTTAGGAAARRCCSASERPGGAAACREAGCTLLLRHAPAPAVSGGVAPAHVCTAHVCLVLTPACLPSLCRPFAWTGTCSRC